MKISSKFILSVFVILLASCFLFQLMGQYRRREKLMVPDFNQYLLKGTDDWIVEDKPLAESPEMQKAIEGILRYDAAIYRTYRRGNVEISVYLGYWQPGKVHREAIDTHTPDVCWVANGWAMKKGPDLGSYRAMAGPVKLTNYRKFDAKGFDLTVLYWHIEGNNLIASHSVEDSKQSAWDRVNQRIRQVWTSIWNKPVDQLFVRVSSNGDIAGQLDLAPVASVLNLIAIRTHQGDFQ